MEKTCNFQRANITRMAENMVCTERVEEFALSCLKGLDRFNNYTQTYKRLCLLEWFQTSLQWKQQKVTVVKAFEKDATFLASLYNSIIKIFPVSRNLQE